MNKIYTRHTLNRILYALIGRWDSVDLWWNSSNVAFEGKTPVSVYWSGEEGRREVADYILKHAEYNI